MGAEKSKLAKETGYSPEAMQSYEDLYQAATRGKKEPITALTLHFRLNMSLNTALSLVRLFDTDRDGSISFAELVLGYYTLGAAPLADKIDAVVRLYDVHNDGFLTSDNLLQITDDIGSFVDLDNLLTDIEALCDNLEAGGVQPPDLAAIHDRVAARALANPPPASASSSSSSSNGSKTAKKKKRAAPKRSAAAAVASAADADTDSAGSSETDTSASTHPTTLAPAPPVKEPAPPAAVASAAPPAKDAAKEASKKEKGKKGAEEKESVRVRSARNRLAIGLPLYEKTLEFGAKATLCDAQRFLMNDLLSRCGVEQTMPVVHPNWDEDLLAQPSTPAGDSRGRAAKDGSLAVPAPAKDDRARSRSPLKKGKGDSSSDAVAAASAPPAAAPATASTTSAAASAANGAAAAAVPAAAAPAAAPLSPRRMTARLGVTAQVFREQAALNPALLFAILHFRRFTQGNLLHARPRERRISELDYFATARTPITIDLSNLAKTEREIVRRRKQDEELMREKQKRELRDLEELRRMGRSGSGGNGGASSAANGNAKDSASGLSSSSKKQAAGGSGGSGGGSNGSNGLSASSALGGMATLSMSGAGAALFSR